MKKVSELVITAAMTAVLCVAAPITVPIGPIPLSLSNFLLMLALYILGIKRTLAAFAVYLLIGAVGLPVFSGFSGGIAKLFGPTGGFLFGFIPMLIAAGLALHYAKGRLLPAFGMLLGTLLCYACGTAWYCVQTGAELTVALGLCVLPFIPGDLLKLAAAMWLGPILRKRIVR